MPQVLYQVRIWYLSSYQLSSHTKYYILWDNKFYYYVFGIAFLSPNKPLGLPVETRGGLNIASLSLSWWHLAVMLLLKHDFPTLLLCDIYISVHHDTMMTARYSTFYSLHGEHGSCSLLLRTRYSRIYCYSSVVVSSNEKSWSFAAYWSLSHFNSQVGEIQRHGDFQSSWIWTIT